MSSVLDETTLAELLASPLYGLSVAPRIIPIANPAAAANWSQTVPQNVVWFVQGIVGTLTTDANVANRQADLEISDGVTVHTRVAGPALHLASLAVRYSWTRGVAGQAAPAAPASWQAGFPFVPLFTGWTVASATRNIQAADAWTAVAMNVLEMRTRDVEEVALLLASHMNGQTIPFYGLATALG